MTPTLHLFRRSPKPDLYCAIPESRPVPDFLGRGWQYAGSVQASSLEKLGVRQAKAREAVDRLGFYLFHSLPSHEG